MSAPSGSTWQSYKAADGKPYWFNTQTKQSVWEKPEELKTPVELALAELGWKQYESAGKPYYVNTETKATTWTIPDDVKSKADQKAATIAASRPVPTPPAAGVGTPPPGMSPAVHSSLPARPGSIPTGPAAMSSPRPDQAQGQGHPAPSLALAAPGQFIPGVGGSPFPGAPQLQQHHHQPQQEAVYDTFEEAEKAFMNLLRMHNVTPAWTWEQVLRTTVTDPAFKALKTLQERKNAFEKYCEDIKKKDREAKEKSMDRNRPAWRTALGRLSEGDYGMKSWWAWERAAREIKNQMPDVWSMSRNDDERRSLWQEYMDELDRKEAARQQEFRQSNIEKLALILKDLSLDLSVRFQSASNVIRGTKEWSEDTELQAMDPLDFLIVYEENVKRMEQESYQQKIKEKTERQRQIRKNREAYIALLDDLKEQGKIKAGTKWKEIFPIIKEDERFTNMLGNPGSTPLELFWDLVDDLDLKVEGDTRVIENVMNERGVKANAEEDFATWDSKLNDDSRVNAIKIEARELVHETLLRRLAQQAREERRRLERKIKHQVDDLRYALRDLDPPIEPGTSYEDAVARFQDLPEYKALTDEAGRKAAYERYIKRQAEKLQEEKERKKESAYPSDTESKTSRRTRHHSRVAEVPQGSPKRNGSHLDVPPSPARSSRAKDRDASPSSKSRKERSRDRDDRRSDKDRKHRDADEPRERTRDREYGDKEHRSSRSYRDRDYDDDARSSRRSSRRDDEERDRDRDREGRSDRQRENKDRHREPEKERDSEVHDKDRDRTEHRRSRRRDESKDRSSKAREKPSELRESKRARLENGEGNKDKEEGEI